MTATGAPAAAAVGAGTLDGRVIIVTGASSGLGARMARALHREGASVVLAARRAERIADLAAELPGSEVVACDVTDEDSRAALVDAATSRFGRLDGLLNNAGVSKAGPALRESPDDFRWMLETNLVAPFALARLAAIAMRRTGGGSVVNVSSVMGLRSIDEMPEAGYVASKAGLIGLTRELASQWGRHDIRVNALAPGFFPSEMTAELLSDAGRAPDWLLRETPLGRAGRTDELDGAVTFLLGPQSTYVSGQVLAVDGGLTTR